jgi:hypothetical protein
MVAKRLKRLFDKNATVSHAGKLGISEDVVDLIGGSASGKWVGISSMPAAQRTQPRSIIRSKNSAPSVVLLT